MDGLEKFNVAQNKLVKLPSPISRLSSLTDLDISYNEIRELPEDFSKLKLKRFGYAGNKLKGRKKSLILIFLIVFFSVFPFSSL